MKLYAGLDTDGIAKLFFVGDDNQPKLVDHQMWLEITKDLHLQAGEMPCATFDPGFAWFDKRLARVESILTQLILSA